MENDTLDILEDSCSAESLKLNTAEESTQLATPTSKAILFSLQYTCVTPISINGSCGSPRLTEYTSKSVCLMSMQLNLMAQIPQRRQSTLKTHTKSVCSFWDSKPSLLFKHHVIAVQIRLYLIAFIPLDVEDRLS